jgi:hypothetical protein
MALLFYREYNDKRHGDKTGNCLAVFHDKEHLSPSGAYDAIGPVFYTPNSECASTGVSPGYLAKCCKKISKEQAYKEHPNLKKYMED